jgi:hypothetical protein
LRKKIINPVHFLLKLGQFLCQMFIFTGFVLHNHGGRRYRNTLTKPVIFKNNTKRVEDSRAMGNFPGLTHQQHRGEGEAERGSTAGFTPSSSSGG